MTLGIIVILFLGLMFLGLILGSILFLSAGEIIGGLGMAAAALVLLVFVGGATLWMSNESIPVNNHPMPIPSVDQSQPDPFDFPQEIQPTELPEIAHTQESRQQQSTPVSQEKSEEPEIDKIIQPELPEWVEAAAEKLNRQQMQIYLTQHSEIPEKVVIQTGLWSTQEEVTAELQQLAKQLAKARGVQILGEKFETATIENLIDRRDWKLQKSHYRTQQRELTPGVNSEMHQAWAEVDLRSAQYAPFWSVLRDAEVKTRLSYLGIGLAGILLVLGAGIVFVDRRPHL